MLVVLLPSLVALPRPRPFVVCREGEDWKQVKLAQRNKSDSGIDQHIRFSCPTFLTMGVTSRKLLSVLLSSASRVEPSVAEQLAEETP